MVAFSRRLNEQAGERGEKLRLLRLDSGRMCIVLGLGPQCKVPLGFVVSSGWSGPMAAGATAG
jgi:hypothetical protein